MMNKKFRSHILLVSVLLCITSFAQVPIPANNQLTIANQLIQQAYSFERLQRFEEALDAFDKVRLYNPNDAGGWLGTSRMLIRLRRFEDLKKRWLEDVQKSPVIIQPQLRAELGGALWMVGDVVGARNQWELAITPRKDETAFNTLYYSLLPFGIYEEVLRFFLESRETNPNLSFLSNQIFSLYVMTMNPEGAVKEAIFQTRQRPESEREWSAKLAQFSGDTLYSETMIRAVEQELKARNLTIKERSGLLGLLGGIKFHSAIFKQAVQDFILADSLQQGTGERLFEISDHLLAEGQLDAATLALEYAKRKKGIELAHQLYLLGKLSIQSGDTVKAREFWYRTLTHHSGDPKSEEAALLLVRSYLPNSPSEAETIIQKMTTLFHRTRTTETSVLMVEAMVRLGKIEDAEKEIKNSLQRPSQDAHLWRGTLILQDFLVKLLNPLVVDSLLFNEVISLTRVPYNDPASTQSLQERILWNAMKESPETVPVFRQWIRELYQNNKKDDTFSRLTTQLVSNLKKESVLSREIGFRVVQVLYDRIQTNPILANLREHTIAILTNYYPDDARIPTVLLERAKAYASKQELSKAIQDVETILKISPNSPEADIARKLLRQWSRDG